LRISLYGDDVGSDEAASYFGPIVDPIGEVGSR
jgi:hypothetical protein